MICAIYKIINIINHKIYIGQTWSDNLVKYFNKSHCICKKRADHTKLKMSQAKIGKHTNKATDILNIVDRYKNKIHMDDVLSSNKTEFSRESE